MKRPEPSRSVAVLIGTATHDGGGPHALQSLPAVRANVTELARLLTAPPVDLVAADRCLQLLDLPHPDQAGVTLADRCREAEDLLLVYYAGHGLLDDNGELFLALPGTDSRPDRLKFTAIPYSWINEAVRDSPARTRVVILDCCYAGRSLNAMSPTDAGTVVADHTQIEGTYTLAATAATAWAIAPGGADHTAFTGVLLDLLRDGPPARDGDPADGDLTLDGMYKHLHIELRSRGLPRPTCRNTDFAADLVLRPGRAVEGSGAPPGTDPPSGPPTTAVPAVQTAHAAPQPVIDTLRRPQTLLHPLHWRLLATPWRRFGQAVLALALGGFLLGVWGTVRDRNPLAWWQDGRLGGPVRDVVGAVLVIMLASSALADWRRGFRRDARIKWGPLVFAAASLAIVVALGILDDRLAGMGVRARGRSLAPLVLTIWATAVGLLIGALTNRSHMWWGVPAALALFVGPVETGRMDGPGDSALGALAVVSAFVAVALLAAVRLFDCLSGHLALAMRPRTVTLSRRGLSIRTATGDRLIMWHHLDRVFVAGHVLAVTFMRDYPETEKPHELARSAALGGFAIADIRHFPHSRGEILHAIAHFAGATFHGTTEPTARDDDRPTRADGRPASWYHQRWSSQ
ncbi:hypothetical protein CA850_01755 [Micromonospora echinospora]|uniref:Uncharacterized protein, contains caspase domain n=1 Tax=Micromonospora echinospora TaxID=1877 RepID=A0A1C4YAZ1_MICEC|nr:caspase family protein [Micromonospora echinospora]OZV84597.1 hypothetical protein CA850_01755 [Micromonospora echinospora]SCF17922.1 Uncharacterized protein, contains caspase domain [Micromonospora echinospora]